ncbi:MAG: FHA domain-containing protein [SAR202 cluster bacterium]|nr:FHA domain-containing protein [SAR202 cluster bacterium]
MMVEVGAAATLLVRGGPNNGVIIKLTDRPITLGRRQDNDVVIDETTVSRRHSLILDTPGGFVLRDLNTTNGTYVNQKRIGQNENLLNHGDHIKLGGSEVTLVFQIDAPGTVMVEAANTPPHGTYITEPPPSEEADSELNEAESALMTALATRKGVVVSRDELSDEIWPDGAENLDETMTLDTVAARLRAKLEMDPENKVSLVTVGGFGFVLL